MNETKRTQGSESIYWILHEQIHRKHGCFLSCFPLEQSLMSGSACVTVDFYLYDACRSVCTTHFCTIIIFTLRITLLYTIYTIFYSSSFLVCLFASFVCVTLNCFTPPFWSRESFCFHRRRELCGRTNTNIALHIRTHYSRHGWWWGGNVMVR